MKWRKLTDERPSVNAECLITDGETVTAGCYSPAKGFRLEAHINWHGLGFSGYEWGWDIDEVTHWMPISELPPVRPSEGGKNARRN